MRLGVNRVSFGVQSFVDARVRRWGGCIRGRSAWRRCAAAGGGGDAGGGGFDCGAAVPDGGELGGSRWSRRWRVGAGRM